MEPFVCSPIRHVAPDGAWFSGGGRLSYKHGAPNGAMPDGPPPTTTSPSPPPCLRMAFFFTPEQRARRRFHPLRAPTASARISSNSIRSTLLSQSVEPRAYCVRTACRFALPRVSSKMRL